MVRMKILFIACVYSITLTQSHADQFIQEHLELINFKNLHEYFPDTGRDHHLHVVVRDIEIESGQSIDISSQQPDTFDYYKSIVSLYCQVLDHKFLNGLRPRWSLLSDLDNLNDDAKYAAANNESAIKTKNPKSLSKRSAVQRLLDITYQLLLHYDALIQPIGYLERAFYFNALQWLQIHIKTDETVGGLIDYIKYSEKKATSYLNEFIPWEKLDKFINYRDERFKKLDGWMKFDNEYDVALAFLMDMMPSDGKAANDILMRVTDMEAYEYILMHAEPGQFHSFMKIEIWDGIRLVDNIFHERSKIDHAINDPYTKGIFLNDIDMTKLDLGTIRFYKHLTILFIGAMELSFNTKILPDPVFYQLVYYPERDDELFNEPEIDPRYYFFKDMMDMPTRYCAFQMWISSVIFDWIQKAFEQIENIPKLIHRLYPHRLIQWYFLRACEDNEKMRKCSDVFVTGIKLQEFLKEKWPIVEVAKNERGRIRNTQIVQNANTINDLLVMELGANDDRIMAIMLCVTLAELDAIIKENQAKVELLQEGRMDEDERANAISAAVNDANNALKYLKTILTFGEFNADMICTGIDFYADYIYGMDEGDFFRTFVMEQHTMLDSIKSLLEQHCSTPQSPQAQTPKDHDTETSLNFSHQNNNQEKSVQHSPENQEKTPQHGQEHREMTLQHSPEYYGHPITPPKFFQEIEHNDKKSPESDHENRERKGSSENHDTQRPLDGRRKSSNSDHQDIEQGKSSQNHNEGDADQKTSPQPDQKDDTKNSTSPPKPLFDGAPPAHLPKLRIPRRR